MSARAAVGNIELRGALVLVAGATLNLTPFEYVVLERLLLGGLGTLVSQAEFTAALYADRPVPASSNVVQVLVSRVRILLRNAGADTTIACLRGHGYLLKPVEATS